ncbi:MAG: hypothetical protein KVP17_000816 [Porospora cf. gigantea B]|uniref:uncharacterized protein n=1 Tax=Porospora cf. gigantea B TaxID=2853592 RepID=UPI003571CBC3|nr:MAG: hypothetical protein KVP17_000816 [Porospora cf. gigantea B]
MLPPFRLRSHLRRSYGDSECTAETEWSVADTWPLRELNRRSYPANMHVRAEVMPHTFLEEGFLVQASERVRDGMSRGRTQRTVFKRVVETERFVLALRSAQLMTFKANTPIHVVILAGGKDMTSLDLLPLVNRMFVHALLAGQNASSPDQRPAARLKCNVNAVVLMLDLPGYGQDSIVRDGSSGELVETMSSDLCVDIAYKATVECLARMVHKFPGSQACLHFFGYSLGAATVTALAHRVVAELSIARPGGCSCTHREMLGPGSVCECSVSCAASHLKLRVTTLLLCAPFTSLSEAAFSAVNVAALNPMIGSLIGHMQMDTLDRMRRFVKLVSSDASQCNDDLSIAIMHGKRDKTCPVWMAKALFTTIEETTAPNSLLQSHLHLIPNADHINILSVTDKQKRSVFAQVFLELISRVGPLIEVGDFEA